jgi:hypothetical protein
LAALLHASGVRTVLGSTEEIGDETARIFAETFYAEGGAETPGSAFRRTILALSSRSDVRELSRSFKLYGSP